MYLFTERKIKCISRTWKIFYLNQIKNHLCLATQAWKEKFLIFYCLPARLKRTDFSSKGGVCIKKYRCLEWECHRRSNTIVMHYGNLKEKQNSHLRANVVGCLVKQLFFQILADWFSRFLFCNIEKIARKDLIKTKLHNETWTFLHLEVVMHETMYLN